MTLGTVILRDLLANRPAASIEGRLFFPTDVGAVYAYRDTGSAWQQINIQGPTGAAGSAGAAGAAATISVGSTATGSAGSSAIVSNSGTSSAAVLDFVVPQGAAGSAGAAGAAGADGKTLRNGTGAPSSGLGVDGDFYIDTAAEAIYGPKTSGAWGSSTSLVGPAGSSGGSGVVTATTPLAYNSGTQTVSIQQANGSEPGYLAAADWTTFNGKLTSPLTTKGDLHSFSTTDARVAVGTDGQRLVADSTQSTGLKWANDPVLLPCSFVGKPGAGATVLLFTATQSINFAANFAGSYGNIDPANGANPASTASYTVKKYSGGTLSTIGTVSVSSSGTYSFSTTGGSAQSLAAGDLVIGIAPLVQDATLSGAAWTLAATRS